LKYYDQAETMKILLTFKIFIFRWTKLAITNIIHFIVSLH